MLRGQEHRLLLQTPLLQFTSPTLWPMTTCNSSSRESHALFWIAEATGHTCNAHMYMQMNTHTYIIKINQSLKQGSGAGWGVFWGRPGSPGDDASFPSILVEAVLSALRFS